MGNGRWESALVSPCPLAPCPSPIAHRPLPIRPASITGRSCSPSPEPAPRAAPAARGVPPPAYPPCQPTADRCAQAVDPVVPAAGPRARSGRSSPHEAVRFSACATTLREACRAPIVRKAVSFLVLARFGLSGGAGSAIYQTPAARGFSRASVDPIHERPPRV